MATATVRKNWPALEREARKLRLRSVPMRDIANRLDVPLGTLETMLGEHGKLTAHKARLVWQMYHWHGHSQRRIAAWFKVSRSCVFGVTSGETWTSATSQYFNLKRRRA